MLGRRKRLDQTMTQHPSKVLQVTAWQRSPEVRVYQLPAMDEPEWRDCLGGLHGLTAAVVKEQEDLTRSVTLWLHEDERWGRVDDRIVEILQGLRPAHVTAITVVYYSTVPVG